MTPAYQDAHITAFHGEALRLLMDMPDDSVDGVATDPPYSSGGQYRGDRNQATSSKYALTGTVKRYEEFSGDNRDQRAFLAWASLWLSECARVTRPGGPLLTFCDWRQIGVMSDAIQAGGWVWRGLLPWNKTAGARPQKGWFRAQCEYILTASHGSMGKEQDRDGSCLEGFFTHPVDPRDKWHQTGKPLGLMLDLLQVMKPGSVVLDPFGGGLTTALACRQLDLQCITFEKCAGQLEQGIERLKQAEALSLKFGLS